jgi:TPR repeat protein
MYQEGAGTAQDDTQALAWYSKAAQQGLAAAEDNLGLRYYKGLGTSQDYAQALIWFSKAAQQGSATAQSNLGYMYLQGLGVTPDRAQARAWLVKSADQGNENARTWLAELDSQPTPQSLPNVANAANGTTQKSEREQAAVKLPTGAGQE